MSQEQEVQNQDVKTKLDSSFLDGKKFLLFLFVLTWGVVAFSLVFTQKQIKSSDNSSNFKSRINDNAQNIAANFQDLKKLAVKINEIDSKIELLEEKTNRLNSRYINQNAVKIEDVQQDESSSENPTVSVANAPEENVDISKITEQISAINEKLEQSKTQNENNKKLLIKTISLKDAIESGEFEKEFDDLHSLALSAEDAELLKMLKDIEPYKSNLVKNIVELQKDFALVADKISNQIRESKQNKTLADKAVVSLSSVISIRKVVDESGKDDPENLIARVHNLLNQNNIQAALSELEKLPDDLKKEVQIFMDDLKTHVMLKENAQKIFDYVAK